ncbi:MAG: GNAT family N-acetyltransferase [Bacteroidales bacterium]|nr:GNAT family N-acetyltransferase [Bacteroidales bacterium]
MRLQEVTTSRHKAAFHKLPRRLYKTDRNWTCPLDIEIENIFNPQSNGKFKNGNAVRWLLIDDSRKVVGRIAAFIDTKNMNNYRYPAGGCGFFECINNQQAANMLFDAAKNWLQQQGAESMLGPVNFGENFNHWGLLVDGFIPQAYGMPYNFPYYKKLFENYGFKNYFEQYSYHKPLADGFPERMLRFAEYTEKRPGYSFDHFSFDRLEEFTDYFVEVYNTVWKAFHDNYEPLGANDMRELLVNSKPIIDEELLWFAFDKGRPVGLLGVVPDVNQLLRKLKNGKLNLLNKLRFIYYRKRAITRCRAFVAGIYPEYQNTGIIAALFFQLVKVLGNKPGMQEIELSWVGDYNPKMIGIYEKMGGKKMKTHVTYMYLFRDDMVFERFTNEFEGKLY